VLDENSEYQNRLDSVEAERWLHQRKIRILLQNHRQSWALIIVVSAILLFLSHGEDNFYISLIWWLSFTAFTVLRAWLTGCFSSPGFEIEDYKAWHERLLVLAFIAGAGWGIGAALVSINISPLMQMYVLLILMGVSSASVPLLGAYMNIMWAFQIPALWPYMLWLAYNVGGQDGVILFLILFFYVLSIVIYMRRLEANFTESLSIQYEFEHLAASLSERNQQLQQANEKLEQLTLIDSLTKIHNRRYFEMQLEKEWKRCIREQQCLSIIMIDIDYFKLYNDAYGHAGGDDCLRRVAHNLRRTVNRPGDVLARIGGEEFVAMLPCVDETGAYKVAESMQKNLQQAKIPHAKSSVSDYLTASMGVASIYPSAEITTLMLFKLADKALYKAKENGRNQIVVAQQDL